MRPMMRRGLIACRVAGERPSFSRTPGRKGSIMMSAWGRRDLMKVMPLGDFRSTAMEDLCRVSRSPVGAGRVVGLRVWVWLGMERSTRKTEAP